MPYPNNRVELRYETSERRAEKLTGGLPGWSWLGLKPLLRDLDALYINFMSGWELDLETCQLIRQHFTGPIYCDLHMLVHAVQPDGWRTLQPLPNIDQWCRCFDLLQMNEDEVTTVARDPMELAATAMIGRRAMPHRHARLARRGVLRGAGLRSPRRSRVAVGAVGGRSARCARRSFPSARVFDTGDPTGCGDVWGATYFSRLLAGDDIADAMRAAHARRRSQRRTFRGATGLARHLRGELITQ